MTGAWLEPIEIQGTLPHRILVVSDNREDYYVTVRLCLEQGQNMEVIFKTYGQLPGEGTFDLVVLFSPQASLPLSTVEGILARSQCRGCLVVVDGGVWPQEGDAGGRVRAADRAGYPSVVRGLLAGVGGEGR